MFTNLQVGDKVVVSYHDIFDPAGRYDRVGTVIKVTAKRLVVKLDDETTLATHTFDRETGKVVNNRMSWHRLVRKVN